MSTKLIQLLLPFPGFEKQLEAIDKSGGFSDEYRNHLRSVRWKQYRSDKLVEQNYTCERCGVKQERVWIDALNKWVNRPILDIDHHRGYRNLGHERRDDTQVLCRPCHEIVTIERRLERQRLSETAYQYRVECWAEKVYGSDWQMYYDYDDVAQEFESWLERKGYD